MAFWTCQRTLQRRLLLLIAEAFLQHHGPQRLLFKIQEKESSNKTIEVLVTCIGLQVGSGDILIK